MLVVEDLQWSDPSTLTVLTARPGPHLVDQAQRDNGAIAATSIDIATDIEKSAHRG